MKIGKVAGVETRLLEMPYTKPLVTATNNFTVARGLLVKVVTDGGIEGYGYSDLFPRTGETPQTAQHVIDTVLRPKVVGRELEDLARVRADIDHALTGNPRAKAALETAMYDALARSYHMPLVVMLGGKYRSEIRVIKMVSVDTPEKMAEEARQLARDGLALKLKVSGKIDKDLPRVAAVRKAVGDDVFIKIDANEAYDAKTAIRLAKSLADHGIEVFEQPVPRVRCALAGVAVADLSRARGSVVPGRRGDGGGTAAGTAPRGERGGGEVRPGAPAGPAPRAHPRGAPARLHRGSVTDHAARRV